jgi:hypothetical protein
VGLPRAGAFLEFQPLNEHPQLTQHKSLRPEPPRDPREEATTVRRRSEHDEVVPKSREQEPRTSRSSGLAPESGVANCGDSAPVEDSPRISRYPAENAVASGKRLDEMVEAAQRLLLTLSPTDRRRRLLHAAIVRRDEMLLEGFIKDFES